MLVPNFNNDIPEMTVEVALAAFPKKNAIMEIRNTLGSIFEDKQFASMYPTLGQPAMSPTRLALVTILQFMEGLTDREAANAVRGRIDWKYLLGLELTDSGFHYSVLSEFRGRLVEHGVEEYLLEKVITGCEAAGLLKGKKKQRTDSTHIVANIGTLNRVELAGETLRRALDDIAQVAPEWLKGNIQPEWGKRYSRKIDTRLTRKQGVKKAELAQAIGEDGTFLLKILYQDGTPLAVTQLPSVAVLRQVWVQQYIQIEEKVCWRIKKEHGLPPARKMISSPDDLEARYGSKGGTTWTGYKVHLTETCTADAPHLITHVETTVATTTDGSVTAKIQDDLIERDLSPESHWTDGGYTHGEVLLSSQKKGIDLIGPMHRDTSWQAKLDGGYDQTKFTIAWDEMVATCPEGENSIRYQKGKTPSGKPTIQFAFSVSTCHACVSRQRCTQAKKVGRSINVPPQEIYEALRETRQRQETPEYKELYNRRAGIEGTIGQTVNAKGGRKSRYRGLAKTHIQHLATAAAINLERVARWVAGERPETRRISPFAALVSPF